MDESTRDAGRDQRIDLAQEADFELGSLHVRPAICEVERNDAAQTLQRRVMQVLVALAQARGSVVSQNDLVARCWRGLSVSDDAIVRCISMLRKLAAACPEAPFAIETIPGVGYRLTTPKFVEHDRGTEDTSSARRPRFRAWQAPAALLVLALAAATFWIGYGRIAIETPPNRVRVQPFDLLSNSRDVGALGRRIPNEVVD